MGISHCYRNGMRAVRKRFHRGNDIVCRIKSRRDKLPVYIKIGRFSLCRRSDLKVRSAVRRVVVRIAYPCIRIVRHVGSVRCFRGVEHIRHFVIIIIGCKRQTSQPKCTQYERDPVGFSGQISIP